MHNQLLHFTSRDSGFERDTISVREDAGSVTLTIVPSDFEFQPFMDIVLLIETHNSGSASAAVGKSNGCTLVGLEHSVDLPQISDSCYIL